MSPTARAPGGPDETDVRGRYLVCITIGPAFLSASIYLCLARLVVLYGESLSRFRPATYTIFFISCDFLSLLLQATGGAIASTAKPGDVSTDQLGINIMIAGLSFQVASLFFFIVLCSEFAFRVWQRRAEISPVNTMIIQSFRFKAFIFGMSDTAQYRPASRSLTLHPQPSRERRSSSSSDPVTVWRS